MNLPHVNAWNYDRSRSKEVKLVFEVDKWLALALDGDEEVLRVNGDTPGEAMRALDAELGGLTNSTGGGCGA